MQQLNTWYSRKASKTDEECIWIIRFSDNSLASYFGKYKDAQKKAEELKDFYGGDYVIS